MTSIGEEFPRGDPIVPGTILPANVPVSSGGIKDKKDKTLLGYDPFVVLSSKSL